MADQTKQLSGTPEVSAAGVHKKTAGVSALDSKKSGSPFALHIVTKETKAAYWQRCALAGLIAVDGIAGISIAFASWEPEWINFAHFAWPYMLAHAGAVSLALWSRLE